MRGPTLAVVLAGLELVGAGQSPAALPDQAAFFAKVRARLAETRLSENSLAYDERSTEVKLNPFGRIGTGPLVHAEVYPFPEVGLSYRRVTERGGRPVPAAELATQDRRFMADLADARRERGGTREREAADARAREAAIQRDVFDVLAFSIEDRVEWEGQPAILVRFEPRSGAKPRTREGRVAAGFSGMAWIHESEYEVMRLVGDAVDDVSFGFGMLARLHRGSHFETRRGPVNGVWVTNETIFRGTGRALMVRHVKLDYRREYFNYRPFDRSEFEATLKSP